MKYEDIQRVNKTLRTTDIKGKAYVEVNNRIRAFRELCPNGSIETNIESLENGVVVMSCTIKDEEGKVLAKAHAYEKEGSTFINKTSFIENCCTSATGRALAYLGIGIDTSVASYEEVANAISNQGEELFYPDDKITKDEAKAMVAVAEQKGWVDASNEILKKFGVTKLSEITKGQYVGFIKELDEQ